MGERQPAGTRLPFPLLSVLVAVTAAVAVGNLGLVSVMPAIGRALSIPDALVASIFSLSAVAWAVMSPIWAALSDRHGRKPMMLIGLAGFSFSMVGCGLVVLAGLKGIGGAISLFLAFAIIRSTYGIFGSAAGTAAQAYVADRSDGQGRVSALSALAGALSIGTIVGPAIAPFFIFRPFDLAGPMFVFTAMGLLLLLLVLFGLKRDRPQFAAPPPGASKSRFRLWRDPALRLLLNEGLVIFSAQAVNTYTLGFAILDLSGLSVAAAQKLIGVAMSVGALSGLVAQVGVVNVLKPSPEAMLRWGALLAGAGNLVILFSTGYPMLLAGFAIASFGFGLARPGFTAALSLAVGPERQGAVAGAVSMIAGASVTLPPIVAMAIYQLWWGAPFLIVAGCCLPIFLVVTMKQRPVFPESD